MTTAARPTFDSRRGASLRDAGVTTQVSSRDMTGYTKLKWRHFVAIASETQKQELEQKEKDHFQNLQKYEKPSLLFLEHNEKTIEGGDSIMLSEADELGFDPQALLKKRHYSATTTLLDADQEEEEENEEEEEEEDEKEEDETAELMKELERIKRERIEEKERRLEALERQKTEVALTGNPLLLNQANFTVKRRWDDDVVFKHQARMMDEKPSKRFINDTLRSDFHKKFIERYIH
jgi:protein CWC15